MPGVYFVLSLQGKGLVEIDVFTLGRLHMYGLSSCCLSNLTHTWYFYLG